MRSAKRATAEAKARYDISWRLANIGFDLESPGVNDGRVGQLCGIEPLDRLPGRPNRDLSGPPGIACRGTPADSAGRDITPRPHRKPFTRAVIPVKKI